MNANNWTVEAFGLVVLASVFLAALFMYWFLLKKHNSRFHVESRHNQTEKLQNLSQDLNSWKKQRDRRNYEEYLHLYLSDEHQSASK